MLYMQKINKKQWLQEFGNMKCHDVKKDKYRLKEQWYPCTPSQFGGSPLLVEEDQNVYTKFTLYGKGLGVFVRFRKQFNIKR